MGRALLADLQGLAQKHELLKEVRGKGLMIGLEFGAPQALRLKTAWHLMDSARRGLFCQLVLIPLLRDHQVLCPVSGDDSYIIQLLPSLTIDERARRGTVSAFKSEGEQYE